MIVKKDLIDHLFEVSPDFQKFISEESDFFKNENLYHVILGCYAHYLYAKYKNSGLDDIKIGFDKLEFLLINGDHEVKNIITLGFFESFQNILLGDKIDLDIFNCILSPGSKKAWHEVIEYWENKNKERKNMILHITSLIEWEKAKKNNEYTAPSLELEGFIHCSTVKQVVDTANLFFKGQNGLVLLCIDETKLKSKCKYENPTGGGNHNPEVGKLFPHVYGPINISAVVKVVDFPAGNNGNFSLPEEISNIKF